MVRTISPQQLASLRAQGQAAELIDVRTPVEFAEVHAAGARLLPLDRLDPQSLLAARSSPDEPIYLICKTGARAAKACQRLAAAGFADAICVEGGTAAWEKAGLPVIRQQGVISLERQVRIAAGLLVLIGVVLGATVHPLFYALSGFVGAGLVFAGITNTCGMGLLLARFPWNKRMPDTNRETRANS